MWIVKKCETGHRQCVSVRQSVRQSLHPIRYIFHAVSQATGSLSHSPFLPLSLFLLLCESLHLAWLLASFSNAACRQQRTKYQVEFSFSASSSAWFTFVPCNNNNNLSTTTTTTVAIIADNQSLHVFHFVFLQSFLAFFFGFLIMPQLDWTNQSV